MNFTTKKAKKLVQKIKKTNRTLVAFIINIKKEFIKMKSKLKKIWGIVTITATTTACGTLVKAQVTQPKNTAHTTITISTNTPVSTDVEPNTNVEFLNK